MLPGIAQSLAIQHQRDLTNKRVQEISSLRGERNGALEPQTKHSHGVIARNQGQVHALSRRQSIGPETRRLLAAEGPVGHALFLFQQIPGAGEVGRERIFGVLVRQRKSNIGVDGFARLADDNSQKIGKICGLGQFAGEQIEGRSALLAPTLGLLLSAQSRRQMPHRDGNDKVSRKHHCVPGVDNAKAVARFGEKEIPQKGC